MLTGRTTGLLELSQLVETSATSAIADGGTSTLPISRIWGTEGRGGYFDRDFRPLHEQARSRWLSIVRAVREGKRLPPVLLTQVADCYSVSDGHHRISVARAMGQRDIEARITILQLSAPLPLRAPEAGPGLLPVRNRLQWGALRLLRTIPALFHAGRIADQAELDISQLTSSLSRGGRAACRPHSPGYGPQAKSSCAATNSSE